MESPKIKPPSGFGKEVNKYLNHHVTIADAKAAGILTGDFALGGYLSTNTQVSDCMLNFQWTPLILLFLSGTFALCTLYPRTPKIGSSIIFWEDIRTRTTMQTYLDELKDVDEDEVERQYGAQNYLISGLLSKKYQFIRWGMWTLMGAIPFVLLKLLLG